MLSLGIDTSSQATSLAICKSDDLIAEYHEVHRLPPSDAVFVELDRLLRDSDLSLAEIDLFAVCLGPGSFTGLRIGIGMAKTMAWSFQRPILGFDGIELGARRLLSEDDVGDGEFAVVEGSARGTLFSGRFRADTDQPGEVLRVGELEYDDDPESLVARYSGLESIWGSDEVRERLEDASNFRVPTGGQSKAVVAARAAEGAIRNGRSGALDAVQPRYLKPFSVGKRARRPEELK